MKKILILFIIITLENLSCNNSTEPESDSYFINYSMFQVSIYGGSDGSIDLIVTGGKEPYSYQWSNGDTTKDINNLPAGTYTVIVQDAKGCLLSDSVKISQPQPEIIHNKT